jgi:tRNA(Ile)-lysidine synthase
MQLARDRPRRALKSILRDAGMPAWQRESLPLVFCGDDLAAVPGIGVDLAFQAAAGEAGHTVHWHPSSGNP